MYVTLGKALTWSYLSVWMIQPYTLSDSAILPSRASALGVEQPFVRTLKPKCFAPFATFAVLDFGDFNFLSFENLPARQAAKLTCIQTLQHRHRKKTRQKKPDFLHFNYILLPLFFYAFGDKVIHCFVIRTLHISLDVQPRDRSIGVHFVVELVLQQ